jgi:hypothetical protein
MKSKLKNICIVIERNTKIERIVLDNFIGFEHTASIDHLESQIVNWSYFDANDKDEEIFFKVYVQRYLSHPTISERFENLHSNEISALLVVRINDENNKKIISMLDLSFHESLSELNAAMAKVEFMSIIRYFNKMSTSDLNFNSSN